MFTKGSSVLKKQKLYKQKRVALERPGMFTKGSRRKNLNIQKRVALERPIKECLHKVLERKT
jgi:hypothetical protein